MSMNALPITATRGKRLRLMAYFLLIQSVPLGAFLYYVLSNMPNATQDYITTGAPAFLVISQIAAGLVWLRLAKAANITIDAQTVKITPMNLFGSGSAGEECIPLSSYTAVGVEKGREETVVYRVFLKAAQKKDNLYLDTPRDRKPNEYAKWLAAALNMKADLEGGLG